MDGFLALIGGKGQFKDFCAQECLKKYEHKQFGKPIEKEVLNCAVCSNEKTVEAELILGSYLKNFLEPAMFCHLAVLI